MRAARLASTTIALTCGLAAAPAAAQVVQPDGTPVPVGGLLQTTFDGRGEQIDAVADAATTPETFVPSCALTFEVLIRNAGYRNSFGWYNVTGQKPGTDELYEFLTCTDDVGTQRVLDIRNDPRWAGGEVGFYQATGGCATLETHEAIFFSEKAYNPDGDQANPFVHLLIYNSTVVPRAFYFGWDDLLSGGDNDFDDLTTFVTGITCSGGGDPCVVDGASGLCAQGVVQCRSGELTCVPTVEPQTEACNGFDDDCDEQIDEGDLCDAGFVCDRGSCVPECGSGEFTCPGGLACDDGFCIDPACVDVDCPEGERCVGGDCRGPCDGVACPHGQTCQLGVCLDPCAAVQCDDAQVCEDGVCVDRCQCKGCGDAESCLDDGHCVEAACAAVTCDVGTHCEGGACVDDCEGAACPEGTTCVDGACAADGGDGGGSSSGPSATIAVGAGGDDDASGAGAGPSSDGGGGGGGAASGSGGGAPREAGPGCDCGIAGTPDGPSRGGGALGLAVAAVGLLASRRRRASWPRGPRA
jgi:MYXO-CTERM domain-containing protein